MPSRTETTLADQDLYSTLGATLKTIKHVYLGLFADEGITEPQVQALEVLSMRGPVLMREMSECMIVSPANITGIVDRLEEKKLVQRTSEKEDRRATIIEITPEGKTLYEKVGKRKGEMIQRSLSTFTKEEKITLNRLLEKLQKGLSLSVNARDSRS